jgi:hypothetical protein
MDIKEGDGRNVQCQKREQVIFIDPTRFSNPDTIRLTESTSSSREPYQHASWLIHISVQSNWSFSSEL